MNEAALHWSYLNILTKTRYEALRETFGSLEAALKHLSPELLAGLSCRSDTIEATLVRSEEFDLGAYSRLLSSKKIEFLTIEDPEYPSRLLSITDPPPFLYYKGDLSVLEQPCIALVGTREMSLYGKRIVQEFVPDFVRAGVVTVSGLALGIDGQVALETLKAGGKTVAALGSGLACIAPQRHTKLAQEIVDPGGLLISEFPLDAFPTQFSYPARNRIIAGLSLATVVLEAPKKSGALMTAQFALDESRDVFAVPGQVFDENYEGCHALIRSGAGLARSAADVIEPLGIIASSEMQATKKEFSGSPEEQSVYGVLTTMPQNVDDLVQKSCIAAHAVNSALTMMELQGVARNVGSGQWVRA